MEGDRVSAADVASGNVRERLRRALPGAIKARDAVTVAALRSALAAIDNAEAADGAQAPPLGAGSTHVAGSVAGRAEVERRSLTPAQMEEIVRAEAADRRAAARDYERAGAPRRAERLLAEARALDGYVGLGRAGPPAG